MSASGGDDPKATEPDDGEVSATAAMDVGELLASMGIEKPKPAPQPTPGAEPNSTAAWLPTLESLEPPSEVARAVATSAPPKAAPKQPASRPPLSPAAAAIVEERRRFRADDRMETGYLNSLKIEDLKKPELKVQEPVAVSEVPWAIIAMVTTIGGLAALAWFLLR